jgi:hypothetical protein
MNLKLFCQCSTCIFVFKFIFSYFNLFIFQASEQYLQHLVAISSTYKTVHNAITEILLKVALNTINQSKSYSTYLFLTF